jgi:hypothetical protein
MTENKQHPTDLVALVIGDLSQKGYLCFVPISQHNISFDFVVYANEKFSRIKVQYSKDGNIRGGLTPTCGFDYFGIYLTSVDRLIYPSIEFKYQKIYTQKPPYGLYYWYEDFFDLTDATDEINLLRESDQAIKNKTRPERRKVERPNEGILKGQIRALGYTGTGRIYGVSDNAIRKWENSINND